MSVGVPAGSAVTPPVNAADPRVFRFDQAVLALGLLGGFVFDATVVIPVFAALATATAALSVSSPFPRLFTAVIANRLGRGLPEDTAPWRTAALLLAVLLGLATLTLVGGDRTLAWLFALLAAALAALAGIGGLCLGCELHGRRRPL